ncbi:MAG: Na+/H+ antiporter subunit E [Candidatus Thiodiazotropha sp. (ex Semelilucina semeliformis)]|nr:Na+/H+ antiporter subunit E [Candidatus Thiodiazotropha sp. (ex Myrtea spinifera)]MCU7808051.1 Na+/H+ antiporter subunit E [Candidatus Thiodiazotropha sp. (ex Semelilucina semeliformis)]MCU7830672.1 Na+/H+ antiporter subunit E [Candidatus Thiodiazotropha sp. (ex Myrtea sp. 'scaly one' KF741663)]
MKTPANEATDGTLAHGVFLFLLLFTLWLLLTGSLDPAELIAGAMVALAVTLISRPHLNIFTGLRLTPGAILPFLSYLGLFLVELIRANLDMARRVLTPSLPLQPALVEVKTELQSPLGRLILANSITLTPGTLTVDVLEDRLVIHWVEVPPDLTIEDATRSITSKFERHLKGFVK